MSAPKRVVVLGGGFAGVYTAKHLTKLLGRRKDVCVELLSDENYFVFQPLLPEVAAGGINATHVVNPIRDIVKGAKFRWCKVQTIDYEKKEVLVSQGEGLELVHVAYDHLVFCLGKVSDFASMPGVAQHGIGMKDLRDAFRLRNHVIRCLEMADVEQAPARKAALTTFVVAGGGFSGVETIGELHELVERSLPYFPSIDKKTVRFVLVHSRQDILPEMPKQLGEAAKRILVKRGVEMVLGDRVRAASPHAVHLQSGVAITARTFVCTVGNAPNPVARAALATGRFAEASIGARKLGIFATDGELRCQAPGGEVVPGHWAVGDCAGVPLQSGELAPGTAQFAIREAATCARNIVAVIDGRATKPFRFKALGSLASLGKRRAVADLMGLKISGFIAWFMWRGIYLSKLPGFVRQLRVALDWTLDLFFPRDITQLQVEQEEDMRVAHYEPGEIIVEEGDVGRELYLMLTGEAIVLRAGEVKATLARRDVFGERALLEDALRTATVQAKTAVDVLVISRGDFKTLVSNMPVLEDYFDGLLRARHPELGGVRRVLENVA